MLVATDPLSTPLAGWGNYPVEQCRVLHPNSAAALRDAVTDATIASRISRGLGRAYGDSALNGRGAVVVHSRLNRFLAFDPADGMLACEAGVSLAEIIEVFLPRGWALPTTPGTKFVTVGGAIAADVHGKNHHADGSFGNFVVDLELLTASGEIMHCSRSVNADVFFATVGGMGLTGAITTARIRLNPVETAYIEADYRRTRDLDHTLDAFARTNHDHRYSMAWIDCLARGGSLGRSVIMLGNDAPRSALPTRARTEPLRVPRRLAKGVPFHFPAIALNSYSVAMFNSAYFHAHADRHCLTDRDAFFYPLDSVHHWNRIYGRRGFVQYQALFPPETSREGLIELLDEVTRSRQASFLAVLKTTGASSPGMLSFPRPGHTLALDLPQTGDHLRQLVARLDQCVLRHGGRLYLAKDAMMSAETFGAMYPRLREFQAVKARVDPHARFQSSQARRLGIVGGR